ncbi:7924_t:CDS:2, partial [Dentiscutata heterogama]
AGIGALRRCTMAQINTSNSFRNPSIAHDYTNTAGNNAVTIGNANPIVFGDIWISQVLYWLRNEYSIVISEIHNLVYGSLAQRSKPIGDFYLKLLKYRKMLNLDEQQIKELFLRSLSPDLEDDVECIGTEQPLADLFEILEQIEM